MTSEIQTRATELREIAAKCKTKPCETFRLEHDPLTGEPLEPVYRAAIPVYDAVTGELREFLP